MAVCINSIIISILEIWNRLERPVSPLSFMRKNRFLILFALGVFGLFMASVRNITDGFAQIPTVAIPTVTGTAPGPIAIVRRDTDQDQINVRSGPSVKYDIIGVLVPGQQVPALGRTPGGDWVQITYVGVSGSVGWVYSPLVEVNGNIPIVEPPPTPTPRTTPTIDPTLAAQFVVELPPTRLPTYTQPPPLVIPTFTEEESPIQSVNFPMGFFVIGLFVVGLFGIIISVLRGQ
jgi:hypothetical protein